MSNLSDWSDVIRRQGEESHAREIKEAEAFGREIDITLNNIAVIPSEELLDLLIEQSQRGFSNVRKNLHKGRLIEGMRNELLLRLMGNIE